MGARHDQRRPAFTVVVPAYNAAGTIRACVSSVLAQTVAELELIVVDDGSDDETARLAAAADDPRLRLLLRRHAGLAAARNAGTTRARAPITCYLDSDDLLAPTYLEVIRAAFEADPGVSFVYSDAWTFDDRTRRVRRATTAHYQRPPRPAPTSAEALFRELVDRNFIIVPVAVRTEAIIAAGLFDETMSAVEDWEMWLRLAAQGHRAAEAPGPLGLRRQHRTQLSADLLKMIDNQIYTLQKLLDRCRLSEADRARVALKLERTLREREVLDGSAALRSAIRRGRTRLARVRRYLDPSRGWHRVPPDAVTAAFGDLRRL